MAPSVRTSCTFPVGSQAKFWVPIVVVREARRPSRSTYEVSVSGPLEPVVQMVNVVIAHSGPFLARSIARSARQARCA
jgi:hypothetical protein